MKPKQPKPISRRNFLGKTSAAIAGLTIIPSHVVSGLGHTPPSDKLNVAGIGIGGMGRNVLSHIAETENIVALCDVDWNEATVRVFETYPGAGRYKDYRIMLDEMKEIDAVVVATPDHTHAVASMEAIKRGKHVYTEKPLTKTIYEARKLTEAAREHNVATQMGNQGQAGDWPRRLREMISDGVIGDITEVHVWTDRPNRGLSDTYWPQGVTRPDETPPVPESLDWGLFTGPAPVRPYHRSYHPFRWRGWWDFGTGALGDMACHILEAPFKALELGYPTKVQGSSSMLLRDSAPVSQKVRLVYPRRQTSFGIQPEVEIDWYDGGLQPVKPEGWTEAQKYKPDAWPGGGNMNHRGGAVIFHGSKDTMICGCYGADPWLLSGRVPDVPKTERRVDTNHYMDWVRACKESPESRVEAKSAFHESGPFNEMVVMGVLAVRLQALNKELHWDGENMQFTNIGPDESLRIIIEDGFTIEDGHPSFRRDMTEPLNAREFANSLIKTNYREGWYLPDMPA